MLLYMFWFVEAEFLDIIEGFFSEVTFPLSRAVHFFRTDFVFTLQCFIFDWQVEKWGKSRVVSWKTTITVDDFYSSWPERVERTDAHCSWVTSTLPDRFSPRQRPIRKIDFSATYLWLESLVFRVMMFQWHVAKISNYLVCSFKNTICFFDKVPKLDYFLVFEVHKLFIKMLSFSFDLNTFV